MNAHSLANKVGDLEHSLIHYGPEVVIASETWLRPEITDSQLLPPKYKMMRNNSTTCGGGVAIILKVLTWFESPTSQIPEEQNKFLRY